MTASTGETTARPMTDEPAITTTDLVVSYGAQRAIDGLSLRVPRGAVYGLLGANGAGKTTLLKTLLGLRPPTSGSAHVLGYAVGRQQLAINARIGYISETNSLYTAMTLPQICAFFQATARRWNQPVVERYIQLFGLPVRARIRQLSKGMRTQLALCLALGSEPDLLLLDEPTTGLDPLARRAFLNVLMSDVVAAGNTVFFSSHILADVEAVADHIGILRAGRLVISDELDALKQRNAHVRLTFAAAPTDDDVSAFQRVPGVVRVEREGRSARLRISGDVMAAVATLRSWPSAPITVDTSYLSLEDIALTYMEESQP